MDIYEKKRLLKKHSPSSPVAKDCLLAFIFGGTICAIGEILFMLFGTVFSLDEEVASVAVTLVLITVAAILTGFGIFDRIAKYAGAGTLVPVTGFSNAVVSEALDSSSEGVILGVGSKIFTVAGPVILFGLASGVLYGIILFFSNLLF